MIISLVVPEPSPLIWRLTPGFQPICRMAIHELRKRIEVRSGDWLGSYLRRDNVVSVLYSEGLNSTKSSVFLQRTDRHGIVGQKSSDFQRFL